MFEHFQLLSFLVILFSGIWVTSYLMQVHNSYPDKVIKAIIIYSIWFILMEIIQFIILYIGVNFTPGEPKYILECINFTFYIGLLFSLYLMLNILLSFRGKSFNRSQNKWLILISSIIIISFIIKTSIPESKNVFVWVDYIQSNLYSLIRITSYIEVLILFGFYFFWKKSKNSIERIKISKSFTLIIIITNGIPAILYYMLRNYSAPPFYEWIIPFSVNFLYFIIIYLWTKFIFLEYAKKMPYTTKTNEKFKAIYDKFKITSREIEIIEFLIEGRTTNEIKDELFISYHTVKNHISHIYEKLNVKTRYELVKFFKKIP